MKFLAGFRSTFNKEKRTTSLVSIKYLAPSSESREYTDCTAPYGDMVVQYRIPLTVAPNCIRNPHKIPSKDSVLAIERSKKPMMRCRVC